MKKIGLLFVVLLFASCAKAPAKTTCYAVRWNHYFYWPDAVFKGDEKGFKDILECLDDETKLGDVSAGDTKPGSDVHVCLPDGSCLQDKALSEAAGRAQLEEYYGLPAVTVMDFTK